MKVKKLNIAEIEALFFDFDGVLTDNKVYLNSKGEEQVRLSRSDGLAFDALRKLKKLCFIVSTEKNKVVSQRARKLRIYVKQNVKDKKLTIETLAKKNKIDLRSCVYVGNDINDFSAMKLCGIKMCPSDSHQKIKSISNFILKAKGGEGVIREIVEKIFRINLLSLLYN